MPNEVNPLVESNRAVQRAVNATQASAAPAPANQDNTGDHGTHQGFAPEYLEVVPDPVDNDGETVALVTNEGVQGDGTGGVSDDDSSAGDSEELKGQALKDRAAELEIEGRGSMTADELREAIAKAEAGE